MSSVAIGSNEQDLGKLYLFILQLKLFIINNRMSQVSDSTSNSQWVQQRDAQAEQERAAARANQEDQINSVKDHYEDYIQSIKDNYHSALQEERAEAESEVRKLKNELYDQRGKTADQLQTQQREHNHENEALITTHEKEIDRERKNGERSSSVIYHQNTEQAEKALSEKDRIYHKFFKENKKEADQELTDLNQQLHDLKSTTDVNKLSPGAVKNLQTAAEMRYYEKLQAAQAMNDTKLQDSRTRDLDERGELKADLQKEQTAYIHDAQKERDLEKKQLISSYQDLQFAKEQEQAKLRGEKGFVVERINLKHAQDLNLQQQRSSEAMQEQRETFHDEKMRVQDDLETKHRAKEREFFVKSSDVRREYERKLTQVEDEHQKVFQEMKVEFDKKLRDQARQSQRFMDDRVKAYENQLKQQELTFKDKEHFLTEHYEEELDKMKHTNARLNQTKS